MDLRRRDHVRANDIRYMSKLERDLEHNVDREIKRDRPGIQSGRAELK